MRRSGLWSRIESHSFSISRIVTVALGTAPPRRVSNIAVDRRQIYSVRRKHAEYVKSMDRNPHISHIPQYRRRGRQFTIVLSYYHAHTGACQPSMSGVPSLLCQFLRRIFSHAAA